MIKLLENIFKKHEELRNGSINLLPSENQLSELAKRFYNGDMGNRYYFSNPYLDNGIKYEYNGTEFIEEILKLGDLLAKEIFSAKSVSFYPISGHVANLTILLKYCKYGDNILVVNPAFGGYPGLDKNKLPKYLGLNVSYFPHDIKYPEIIDIKESIKAINSIKPKVIIYSQAHTLFPIPLKEIVENSKKNNSIFVYDASHPLGLIAGGLFQSPLHEGVDYLVGGTQKSFPGPQGGIILSNFENENDFEHFITVDNPHFNRIAATIVTLAEMKEFGNVYATKVIDNTKYFAKQLFDRGFNIMYPERDFTEAHMFKVKLDENFLPIIDKLKECNIFLDYSGRIGTAEMTRLGMGENEFAIISELFFEISRNNNMTTIKEKVISLKKQFMQIKYGYN